MTHKIEIAQTDYPGGWTIRIDGTDIAGLVCRDGARLDLGDGVSLPTLSLDLMLFPGQSNIEIARGHVRVDGESRELLERLGWKPPDGER